MAESDLQVKEKETDAVGLFSFYLRGYIEEGRTYTQEVAVLLEHSYIILFFSLEL